MQQHWWSPSVPQAVLRTEAHSVVSDSDGNLPFRALLGFTCILLLAPQERIPALAPLRIAMLTAVLAMFAHVWCRWRSGEKIFAVNAPVLLLVALVSWALLTMPFSFWPGGSISYLTEKYVKTIIVFVLLANVLSSQEKLATMAWSLVLMTIPLSLTTLKSFLAGGADRASGYSSSLTANPNDMALMLNLILPMTLALFLGARKKSIRFFVAGVVGLQILAIMATFSRAGFLTLGFIILSYLWLLRRRKERVLIPIAIVACICALPLVPPEFYLRITTIVNIEEDETNSAQTRLADMKVALELVADHPVVGSGLGMNVLAMNEARGTTWTEVHNVYLQLAVELGLPGLLLFLMLYMQCLKQARLTVRYCRNKPHLKDLYNLAEALQVALLAYALEAMFHPTAYHFYFYYIAGMAVAAGFICRRQAASTIDDKGVVQMPSSGSVATGVAHA